MTSNSGYLRAESGTFSFGSKAKTLSRLATHQSNSYTLLPQFILTRPIWKQAKKRSIDDVLAAIPGSALAVRSSAHDEDRVDASNAGRYLSLINVPANVDELADAIDAVFASYDSIDDRDEVLVQPMVKNVAVSGVVFTRDLETGSPYFVIGYDDTSGSTDTVTSGIAGHTIYVLRGHHHYLHSNRFRKLVTSVLEVEHITKSEELDIEFCIDASERIFILQVRPLATSSSWQQISNRSISKTVATVHEYIEQAIAPAEGLSGQKTIFGDMPDWNPAEMIGNTPRPLALSLYKYLITDEIWSRARSMMGYRDVPHPLLVSLNGRPYIDVRLSLNSFLPAGLPSPCAARIVDFQLEKLAANRELHDKIEFDIATTCRSFDFESKKAELMAAGVDKSDVSTFEIALTQLTKRVLENGSDEIDSLLCAADGLLKANSNLSTHRAIPEIKGLLNKCKEVGTLPFSMLARHAFIGTSFLRSLKHLGILSESDLDKFLRSVQTVASDFVTDMARLSSGEFSQEEFLAHYGHLRPGTYDILSDRYDHNPAAYLGHGIGFSPDPEAAFSLTSNQEAEIAALLKGCGFELTPNDLFSYCSKAIKGREAAKFAFSKSISDALFLLTSWGERKGLSKDDISFLPIEVILRDPSKDEIEECLARTKDAYVITRAVHLPHLITDASDVHVVRMPLGRATFITSKKTTAPIAFLRPGETIDVDGKILLIEAADPGFDWIFSRDIRGLITCYGGANSHMAIRCAEFGLPAAIGCGERLFKALRDARQINLNCSEQKIMRL